MTKIGILSDTHGLLRPEVLQALQGCSAILHGGDINRQEMIDRLEQIAPVYVVRGNNDKEWAEHLPEFLDFELCGLRIYMTHKKKDLPKDLSSYDLVVYGHSHKYEERQEGRTELINPGSCGPRRFNQDITLAVLEVDEEGINRRMGRLSGTRSESFFEIRRIDISHGKAPALNMEKLQKKDIEKVISEIKKRRSVAEIATKLGMDQNLTEQICRLYLTHPGVDAEGIMAKMGL